MSVVESSSSGWDTLHRVRKSIRRLVWWSGLSRSVMAGLIGVLLAGWLDWWLRQDAAIARWLLATAVWGGLGWTWWRVLIRPLQCGLSDSLLAEQMDRQFPGLLGRLTAAVEFRQSALDSRQGSRELQQLVIQQATEDLRMIDPRQLLAPRQINPSIAGALVSCVVAAGVLWAFPLEAATALRRLTTPWGQIAWPRSTVLQLTYANGRPLEWDPRAGIGVVRGSVLSLRVTNRRGDLPDDLRLQVREPGQELPVETPLRAATNSDSRAPQFAAVELPARQDQLEFRVIGGDDQTLPWHHLAAVDPPRIAGIEMTVTPPAYSRQPRVSLPSGSTQVRGLIGSQVQTRVVADRPVALVELRVGDKPPAAVTLNADQQSWAVSLIIERPGVTQFSFIVRDAQGYSDPQSLQFELRAEVDALPEVALDEPAADLWVTPDAVVSLVGSATDDLGLTQLERVWQRGDSPATQDVLQEFSDPPLQAAITATWELSPLQLAPGERIVFRLQARDACNLGEPHLGKSAPRSLMVVTPEAKQAELTTRVAELADQLREAVTQEERLATQTEELQTQLREVGRLQPADRDLLNRLQSDQRRLAGQLGNDVRGLGRRAELLRGEFPANRITDNEAEPQLQQLAEELNELTGSLFPSIDSELTESLKLLEEQSPTAPSEADQPHPSLEPLERVATLQKDAAAALATRLKDLARWQSDRQLTHELQSLAAAQDQLNQETAELGAQTLSRALSELAPQQRADLNKLADRQRKLADDIAATQSDFEELAEQLGSSDPDRSATAQAVAEQLQQSQLSMRLRQAGDDLAANRLGAAGPAQEAAQETLQQLQQEWSADPADDVEQMRKQNEEATQLADAIENEVDELRKKAAPDAWEQASATEKAEHAEQARQLRRRVQQLERELQRLQLKRGASAARRAAQRLQQAQQALAAGDGESGRAELEAAAEEIEQLQSEIARQNQELADRLAEEELERIVGTLQALKARQQGVVTETQRLEEARAATGRLTRGQIRSLQDLAKVELELQQLAEQSGQQLAEVQVAQTALQSVAKSLSRAAVRLEDRQTDALTLWWEQDAARRLDRIISAWEKREQPPAENAPENDAESPDETNKPQAAGPRGESVPLQLQLQLLRELQADCLERTQMLEQQRQPDGTLPEAWSELLTDLATEQGQLIQLAQDIAARYRAAQAAAAPMAPAEGPAP